MSHDLLMAIMGLISALITAFVIPWLKVKIGNEKLYTILTWVDAAVAAVEKMYSGSGRGEEKKQAVLDFLASKGVKLTEKELDTMINAALYRLK